MGRNGGLGCGLGVDGIMDLQKAIMGEGVTPGEIDIYSNAIIAIKKAQTPEVGEALNTPKPEEGK